MFKGEKFWSFSIFIIFIFAGISQASTNYNILIIAEDSNIDPGQETRLFVYLPGGGEFEKAKISIIIEGPLLIKKSTFLGREVYNLSGTKSLYHKFTDDEIKILLSPSNINPDCNECSIANWGLEVEEHESDSPLRYLIYAPPDAEEGDYQLSIDFTYSFNESWGTTQQSQTIHINGPSSIKDREVNQILLIFLPFLVFFAIIGIPIGIYEIFQRLRGIKSKKHKLFLIILFALITLICLILSVSRFLTYYI
ncbi:MAG: hypothetical protein PHE43_00300 [Candidatus Nanoarchaeia archaeon]|nr:hypothetical protein [Candidatus Nanoarchaeia archaeon]